MGQYVYGEDQGLKRFALALAREGGADEKEAQAFWRALLESPKAGEELAYYYRNREFACRCQVAGYTVADILVWQVDHFKAYLDRPTYRYDQAGLVYQAFRIFLEMEQDPRAYAEKMQRETGTDYVGK